MLIFLYLYSFQFYSILSFQFNLIIWLFFFFLLSHLYYSILYQSIIICTTLYYTVMYNHTVSWCSWIFDFISSFKSIFLIKPHCHNNVFNRTTLSLRHCYRLHVQSRRSFQNQHTHTHTRHVIFFHYPQNTNIKDRNRRRSKEGYRLTLIDLLTR